MAYPDRDAAMNSIASDLGILRRGSWGARAPAHALEEDWDYSAIVVHNTGHGHLDTMLKIQNFDLDRRSWDDISYHYGILPDGRIFEGRELIFKGADVYKQNTGKIGVVCIGDYDDSVINWLHGRSYSGDPVLPQMMDSLRKLSRRLIAAFPLMRYFGGHMEYGDTNDCPGSELIPYMAELRDELKLSVPIKRSLR